MIADLRDANGEHAFRSLSAILPVIVAMARNANASSNVQNALIPLRRLVRLLVELDLHARTR
jgi:hypothetical protein